MSLVKKDVKRNRTKRVDLKGLYAVPHEIAYANGKPRPEVYGVVTEYAKKLRLGKYEIIPHSMMRGFDCWGAYDMSKYLHLSQIRGKIVPSKQIVNKRAGAS